MDWDRIAEIGAIVVIGLLICMNRYEAMVDKERLNALEKKIKGKDL